MLARYPYFQTVRLLYLKNLFLLHDITFGEELRRAALYIADRKVLFYLIEGERFTITPSEGKEKSSDLLGLDRTLSLIDAFLAGQPEEEQKDITQLPMDITTDYTSYLLTETEEAVPVEEIPSLKGQDLIDEPLLSSQERADEPEPEEKEPEPEDESYFTETLAKIYVKQQRYSKALEIIKKLNLKYPKKNAYFADQIRFLEKLIINTKSK